MVRPITERIAELRKKIAQIRTQKASKFPSVPYQDREAMQVRSAERLQEIIEELRSLNQWKKP